MKLFESLLERLKGKIILYVEDDPGIRKQYEEFLQHLGARVHSARTSQEGKELYQHTRPELIIADINLPDGSGIDMIGEIRRYDTQTRVIMLTAYTDKEYLIPSVELDITRYLVKPVSENELLEAIHKALDQLELQRGKSETVHLGPDTVYLKKTRQLLSGNKKIQLHTQENKLLSMLCECYPDTLTYEEIEERLNPLEPTSMNAIRIQIKNLRKKLPEDLIQNISGVGYQMKLP